MQMICTFKCIDVFAEDFKYVNFSENLVNVLQHFSWLDIIYTLFIDQNQHSQNEPSLAVVDKYEFGVANSYWFSNRGYKYRRIGMNQL